MDNVTQIVLPGQHDKLKKDIPQVNKYVNKAVFNRKHFYNLINTVDSLNQINIWLICKSLVAWLINCR